MNTPKVIRRVCVLSLVLVLGACGGGGDDEENTVPAPPPTQTGIGPTGGTVTGPNGARIEIPAGALASNVDIRIEQSSAGAPALPANFQAFGQMFAFTPHGTTFAVPVTVTLPFDPALVPAGTTPGFYKTNAQNLWERIANATVGATTVTAQITSFSLGEVGIDRSPFPIRQWTFQPTGHPAETGPRNALGQEVDLGGDITEQRHFGNNTFLTVDDDPRRSMEVFSRADGRVFYAFSENSGSAKLRQSQTFIKTADNASLRFVITKALIEAVDKNGPPQVQECPENDITCALMLGHISFSIDGYDTLGEFLKNRDGVPVLDAQTSVTLLGHSGFWEDPSVFRDPTHTSAVFKRENFKFVRDVIGSSGQTHPQVELVEPVILNVDLSNVARESRFRIIVNIHALTRPRGGESEIVAFLRDPTEDSGVTMEFTGLEPTDEPVADPVPFTPVPCAAGTDPAAGVLQFNAASYTQLEDTLSGVNSRGVLVTRTQGSTGAVSATLTANGGTATPGVHYTPLTSSVRFADGDTEPRLVEVEILLNDDAEADRTVNLTLSEPGGCAALGPQSTAVLTIADDDRPPSPPQPSGLDASFGSEGKATSPAFGGDRSAMALQSDGKIVMVGGTFSDFILARFNANGQLDQGFGDNGKVTTNLVAGELEESLGVAIQPDGKIVVAGYTGQPVGPSVLALARYDADGGLDESFGTGGMAISTIEGRGFAVALQSDGRIVVAGDDIVAGDILVARFDANGARDESFGDNGRVVTDIAGDGDIATNLVLQSDGRILVSGGSSVGASQTVLARYDEDGDPDGSFGTAGELLLSGKRVGEGLAVQGDGKIVLVGNEGPGVNTSFATMRLDPDGSPDMSFGNAGTVTTAITTLGDVALAVALQGDGKIVVAGASSGQTNPNFAVARYAPNGTLDTSFSTDGMLTIEFFGFTDVAESVAVQSDGKIVLGGLARDSVDGYGVARVIP